MLELWGVSKPRYPTGIETGIYICIFTSENLRPVHVFLIFTGII